jgi:hypothetical protein
VNREIRTPTEDDVASVVAHTLYERVGMRATHRFDVYEEIVA